MVRGFGISLMLEYLHKHHAIFWGWGSSLNMNLCFMFHSLRVILHNVFSTPAFWLWPITRSHVWNFSKCGSMSALKSFEFSDEGCSSCSSQTLAWARITWRIPAKLQMLGPGISLPPEFPKENRLGFYLEPHLLKSWSTDQHFQHPLGIY